MKVSKELRHFVPGNAAGGQNKEEQTALVRHGPWAFSLDERVWQVDGKSTQQLERPHLKAE